MRFLSRFGNSTKATRRDRHRARFFRPQVQALEDRALPSTYTVLNLADSGEGSLRQAILDANANPGEDLIDFAAAVRGAIGLTTGQLSVTDDLTIDGPGADKLAVSGNHQSRVFSISGGAEVTIAGLTVTDGRVVGSPASGGGILNNASTLNLDRVVLSGNQALGAPGAAARGGAVANLSGATLIVTDSLFTQNQAIGGAGAQGMGGAIENNASHLTVSRSTFVGGLARGGPSDVGDARAGGIDNNRGLSATITDSTFIGNNAIGSDGGNSGFARGGGIYNIQSTLTVANCTFTGNQAVGGSNNTGSRAQLGLAFGGAIGNADRGSLVVTGSRFTRNLALGGSNNTRTGGSGTSGTGQGGALFSIGQATVQGSVFEHNEARGGNGNRGSGTDFQLVGIGWGGAIVTRAANNTGAPVHLTLDDVTLRDNRAVGGDGNAGGTFNGTAWGGGLATSADNTLGPSGGSTTTVSGSMIADNQAVGGRGAEGASGGDAQGGGIANHFGASLTVSDSRLLRNQAVGGAGGDGGPGGSGLGGGIFNDEPSSLPSNPGASTTLDIYGCEIIRNQAVGGAGGLGSSGGQGLGGGLYTGASPVTIRRSVINANRAEGGASGSGGAVGQGVGGGIYIASGGSVCVDALTAIFANDASTSDDDVFGTLCFI